MINVFIGYDTKEISAYSVLSHSIMKNSTVPVSITPIYLNNLKKVFNRKKNSISSTEFSFSRFLTPYLMNYTGWAIFMDCDMLFLDDISKLWNLRDDKFAIQVCKHDYVPKKEIKFLGQKQTTYKKKNWSSLMLMNCEKCKSLDLNYVNTRSGLELHQFKWLESQELIGDLPLEWNWLVGEYDYRSDVKNVHFTEGGPWFEEYRNCDYSQKWFEYYEEIRFDNANFS